MRRTAHRREIHEGELAMADAPQLQLTRRAFGFGASALASSAALGLGRARAQPATCVVGTWGGDYQNLLDANIVKPLLEPKGVNVQWDVAVQGPRKNKLMAERRLPRGTLDIACLSDVDMYDVSLSGALDTLDESKVPNLKNAVAALRHPYAVPHIYSGMVLVYNPAHAQPTAYADLWDEKYRGKAGRRVVHADPDRRDRRGRRHAVGFRARQEETDGAQEARRARAAKQRGHGAGAAVGRSMDHADVARARRAMA